MKTVCDINMCVGCKACIEICPKSSISLHDAIKNLNAVIDENLCINCGACTRVCQKVNFPSLRKPLSWYQGWDTDEDSRIKSSSGGFANNLMRRFLKEGGCVCSCVFSNGKFIYEITVNIDEDLDKYRGSKYVKSDPMGIYSEVYNLLKKGKKVLFIGLPCHVGALRKYLGDKFYENLYTVDLICHGSPSALIFNQFLKERGVNVDDLSRIQFRQNNKFRVTASLESKEISFTPFNVLDRYTIGFLKGLFYTESCYSCQYARLERVSDITIGDSWGSNLETTEEGLNGISLALCQTEKGAELLKKCELKLLPVDLEEAVRSNHQLKNPSVKPSQRDKFFFMLDKGNGINNAVRKCYPDVCFRQDVKKILIKLHIYKVRKKI